MSEPTQVNDVNANPAADNAAGNVNDITKIIDGKFSELKSELRQDLNHIASKVATPPVQPPPEEDLDPNDPNDLPKIIEKKVEEKVDQRITERDRNAEFERARRESDAAAIKEFPFLANEKSEEYALARKIWKKKFGDTSAPNVVDALMQVGLEANYILKTNGKNMDDENKNRNDKGGITPAGGSAPEPRGDKPLTDSQKEYCEKFGITHEAYRKQLARRAAREQ